VDGARDGFGRRAFATHGRDLLSQSQHGRFISRPQAVAGHGRTAPSFPRVAELSSFPGDRASQRSNASAGAVGLIVPATWPASMRLREKASTPA
jgi:hypothetical protein